MKPDPDIRAAIRADDEPPPLLGSWKRVYLAVVLYLAAIIALFWLFTRAYRP